MTTSLPLPSTLNYSKTGVSLQEASLNGSSPPKEQPEVLLQLRQKSNQLREQGANIKQKNKQLAHIISDLSDRFNVLVQEKDLQQRKSRSLMLLVTDLQRQLDDAHLVPKTQDLGTLQAELRALREILLKVAEKAKEDQKLLSFMRQTVSSGPKAAQFVQKSRYLEGQSQLIAKLNSQLGSFTNDNMECARKWSQLQRQNLRLKREEGLLRIQEERIKTQVRQHYQEYLQRLNRSKATLVNFNETQRERVITQHLVEEVARLQERRGEVQEMIRNLAYHQESLKEQDARLQMEGRELSSFFGGKGQEQRLAGRMRARIEELRDSLAEMNRLRVLPRLPLSQVAERVRNQLRHLEETQAFLELKIREEQQGKMEINEKEVVQFFEGVLRGVDEKVQLARQREAVCSQKLREASVRRQLLTSQVENMQQGLRYHSYAQGGSGGGWRVGGTNLATTVSKFV